MKYCSKCGNELLDEAVICPKCGCPAGPTPTPNGGSDKLLKANKQSKIITANILNVIAFGLSIVALITTFTSAHRKPKDPPDTNTYIIQKDIVGEWFGYDTTKIITPDEQMREWIQDETERAAVNKQLFSALCLWEALYIVALIVGFLAAKGVKAGKKGLVFVYMAISVAAPVCFFVMEPRLLIMLVCGIGFILFVPAILSLIAGSKLLQAAAISE